MKSKKQGYLMFAVGDTCIEQACLCAMSIKATQSMNNVSIVTDDTIPSKYKKLFDKVINIPWNDSSLSSHYITEHRWKLYHVTPYKETVVLDTDMLFLTDISDYWESLANYEVFYSTNAKTYRGKNVTSDYYRKTFVANELPMVYCAFHYFKKCDFAKQFYGVVEDITKNQDLFYSKFAPKLTPSTYSMDIASAIAIRVLDVEDKVTSQLSRIEFTHMKARCQDFVDPSPSWQDKVPVYLTDNLELKIGNYKQDTILHYTEDSFVNTSMVSKYERALSL